MRTDVPPHSLLAKRRATRPGVERGGPWPRQPQHAERCRRPPNRPLPGGGGERSASAGGNDRSAQGHVGGAARVVSREILGAAWLTYSPWLGQHVSFVPTRISRETRF